MSPSPCMTWPHTNQRMDTNTERLRAPLRLARHAKRRRSEPMQLDASALEPELEAAVAQSISEVCEVFETAQLCQYHETGVDTTFETCTNLLPDGDGAVRLCTNPKSASSQVCKTCTSKLTRM